MMVSKTPVKEGEVLNAEWRAVKFSS